MGKTTISINKCTREMLWGIMKKKDTYDTLLQRLVETAAALSPQELEEVQIIINHMRQSQPNFSKERVIGRLLKLGLDVYKAQINGATPRYEGE